MKHGSVGSIPCRNSRLLLGEQIADFVRSTTSAGGAGGEASAFLVSKTFAGHLNELHHSNTQMARITKSRTVCRKEPYAMTGMPASGPHPASGVDLGEAPGARKTDP